MQKSSDMLTKSIKEVLGGPSWLMAAFVFTKWSYPCRMVFQLPHSTTPRGCRLADTPTRRSADTASFVVARL